MDFGIRVVGGVRGELGALFAAADTQSEEGESGDEGEASNSGADADAGFGAGTER